MRMGCENAKLFLRKPLVRTLIEPKMVREAFSELPKGMNRQDEIGKRQVSYSPACFA